MIHKKYLVDWISYNLVEISIKPTILLEDGKPHDVFPLVNN